MSYWFLTIGLGFVALALSLGLVLAGWTIGDLRAEVASLKRQVQNWTDAATLGSQLTESMRQSYTAELIRKDARIETLKRANAELLERCGETGAP